MAILRLLIIFVFIFASSLSQANWYFDLGLGDAINKTQDITIYQRDYEDIQIDDAVFYTKGFRPPVLYTLRIGKENEGLKNHFELEHIHHKLYLDNASQYHAKLSRFEVTDGYNLFLINKVFQTSKTQDFIFRLGAGTIYTHPDIHFDDDLDGTIDRTNFQRGSGIFPTIWKDGYHWGGYTLQASVAKTWIYKNLQYGLELKYYQGAANIPVDNGHVYLPMQAFSAMGILGYRF